MQSYSTDTNTNQRVVIQAAARRKGVHDRSIGIAHTPDPPRASTPAIDTIRDPLEAGFDRCLDAPGLVLVRQLHDASSVGPPTAGTAVSDVVIAGNRVARTHRRRELRLVLA